MSHEDESMLCDPHGRSIDTSRQLVDPAPLLGDQGTVLATLKVMAMPALKTEPESDYLP